MSIKIAQQKQKSIEYSTIFEQSFARLKIQKNQNSKLNAKKTNTTLSEFNKQK